MYNMDAVLSMIYIIYMCDKYLDSTQYRAITLD